MQCPKCAFEQQATNIECQSCGVIFQKLKMVQERNRADSTEVPITISNDEPTSVWQYIQNLLFYVKPESNPLIVGGKGSCIYCHFHSVSKQPCNGFILAFD